jgi:hypothetical protein
MFVFAIAILGDGLFGGAASPVRAADRVYELIDGSRLLVQCPVCRLLDPELPLAGRFTLRVREETPISVIWDVVDVDLVGGEGLHRFRGQGTYEARFDEKPTQELSLDLTSDDGALTRVGSGPVALSVEFPALEVFVAESDVTEPGSIFFFSMEILAAPLAVKSVRYELVEGSVLVDDCIDCDRPVIEIPMKGSFVLGEIDVGANPVGTWRIDDFSIRPVSDDRQLDVRGGGVLRYGGEVALTQDLRLRLDIEGYGEATLASGRVPVEALFPAIGIDLTHVDPPTTLHVFKLRLNAQDTAPAEPAFRRGDVNADGSLDISDPVYFLLWHFAGSGSAPSCLEAADTNADGELNLTDPIRVLLWLFQGGEAPPAPGPNTCGRVEKALLGCDSYPACAVP